MTTYLGKSCSFCLPSAFRKLSSIYVFSYFPFGFEGRIWDLIVSVPDHCLSFYFSKKIFFKLMNNAVFGKTLENLRTRINLKLTSNEDIYTKHASIVNFISDKMFNENLFAIKRIKEELVLNRPIYVGTAILDLSKLLMYDFHYNYMLNKYNIKLMFTDTDSLCYEIKTGDVYKDLFQDKELFDNSDYPQNSEFFFDENKKVIGKMKDEAAGMVIKEFIGLRSKMYTHVINNKTTKKCKGVSKHTIKKDITIDDYRDTLFSFSSTEKPHSMKSIKSHNHIIKKNVK